MPRFSEAKYTAVGAFIFLRFFCPAIVAPEVEGLVATPPSKEIRRGLLLIAKVVQNLANNVLFGAKEPFMFPLNDFLAHNIYRVTTFLREISVRTSVYSTERAKQLLTERRITRFLRTRSSRHQEGSRSISGLVSLSTAFSMITGIMSGND